MFTASIPELTEADIDKLFNDTRHWAEFLDEETLLVHKKFKKETRHVIKGPK